ncbi:cytochrome C [Caldimonas sp. KR1-144]|uniref:cytochrome C n=1 Tax=Caldimonas sp. KR1-144 TaxID=3400911 RepID=UPI003BFD574A
MKHAGIAMLASLWAAALPAAAQSRGELLYTTHCSACHSEQMHWRDARAARDWPTLEAQVRRWQGSIGLAWQDDDVREVARYLNERFYRFEPAAGTRSSLGGAPPGAISGAR